MKLDAVHFTSRVSDPKHPNGLHRANFSAPDYDLTQEPDGSVRITAGDMTVVTVGIGYWAVPVPAAAAQAPASTTVATQVAPKPSTGSQRAPRGGK